ncbi:MAG: hypothetical protein ACE5IW_04770 [bacterium]
MLLQLSIVILGYLVATIGIGWMIGKISKKIIEKEKDNKFKELVESGLPNAGRYIGWLERTLVITFILVENYNGIGFILAAKGILRFGEIKESIDRKFAEYVILGTLLSFSLSFILGVIMRQLIAFFGEH